MKKSNFNPNEYDVLKNVRKKIVSKIVKKYDLNNKKILDIGCGTGHFSYALAKETYNSFIEGIDIVESYISYASLNNKYKNNLQFKQSDFISLNGKYDVITMFLSLTELLKKHSLTEILKKLSALLTEKGVIVICDEFIDDYFDPVDKLGMSIMQKIGYKYVDTDFLKNETLNMSLLLTDDFIFKTNSKVNNFNGAKVRIFYETKLSEADDTKIVEAESVWQEYKQEIQKYKGIRVNNLIHTFILKKDFLIKMEKIKSKSFDTPTLIYDIDIIKENILYMKDLTSFNVKFNFPVKAFPHLKILKIFDSYNFGFDVSNKNELNLIKEMSNKNKIYYSDPTYTLLKKTNVRLNIYNNYIKSHFGSEMSVLNNSINTIHLHVSEKKTKEVLRSIIKIMKEIDFTYIKELNIGGGYEELSYSEIYTLLQEIRNIIPVHVSIILECGSLWFKNSGYLYTKICHIEKLRNINYVFLNASKECHSKWSNPEILDFFSPLVKDFHYYVFSGSSCYEKDIFCTYAGKRKFEVGDSIILNNIEPYSFSWNNSFNGIDKAEVYFYEE